jgi:hypothetical protein
MEVDFKIPLRVLGVAILVGALGLAIYVSKKNSLLNQDVWELRLNHSVEFSFSVAL